MRILVSAYGPERDAIIAPAFESAPYYLLVDTEAATCTPQASLALASLAQLQVHAVITGHMSEASKRLAAAAGVVVYTIPAGAVTMAVEHCLRGKLRAL